MKNYLKVIVFVIVVLSIYNSCMANPLSSIMSFFQKDLNISVLYKNHKNLIQGSEVYLADDPDDRKTLIGKVTKISLADSQMSKVEIIIDKKYKNKIYETTPFVLMSNILLKNSNPYIVAISCLDETDKKILKSGASVKGISFLEYKIATAKDSLKKVMDSIEKNNKEILSQLEEYIDTLNIEDFQKKLDGFTNQITKFSKEQKKAFKDDVLPALKNMLNSIIEKLENQNNKEKSKELEKRLKKIEKLVDV